MSQVANREVRWVNRYDFVQSNLQLPHAEDIEVGRLRGEGVERQPAYLIQKKSSMILHDSKPATWLFGVPSKPQKA